MSTDLDFVQTRYLALLSEHEALKSELALDRSQLAATQRTLYEHQENARADYEALKAELATERNRRIAAEGALQHRMAIRREIESALGVTADMDNDAALRAGLDAIRALQAEIGRTAKICVRALKLLRQIREGLDEHWEACNVPLVHEVDALIGGRA